MNQDRQAHHSCRPHEKRTPGRFAPGVGGSLPLQASVLALSGKARVTRPRFDGERICRLDNQPTDGNHPTSTVRGPARLPVTFTVRLRSYPPHHAPGQSRAFFAPRS